MLLSRDAIAVGVETCSADDFYKPIHGYIFDAVVSLYGQGEPADPITVADELRRAGLLDSVGGSAALVSLQANTPAVSSAARYARIVEENCLLRKLIGVAAEIAELGYSIPEDVTAAIDRAETMIFEVAQRRAVDTLLALRELLGQTLDGLEALYARGDTITGVPTGYTDLDQQLAGLQPSNLVIVGARPGAGKALALDTPLPTPKGWTAMGSVRVGEQVFDDRGIPCTVTYTSPVQLSRRCYRVEFDDGSCIVADAEHQWFAYDQRAWKSARERHRLSRRGGPPNPNLARDQRQHWNLPAVVTTQQMLDRGLYTGPENRPNWYLPVAGPLELPDQSLPMDPYVLGCWLGDGCGKRSEMTIGDRDIEHFRQEFQGAGYVLSPRGRLQYATVPVPGSGAWQGYRGDKRVLTRELLQVGLLAGKKKHIPACYLRASFKHRLALLQGVMDTDGYANGRGSQSVELCLASRGLLDQVRELVCSLGHRPGVVRKKVLMLPNGQSYVAWRLAWTPLDPVFRLPRKADRFEAGARRGRFGTLSRRTIEAITPIDSVPVRCITVDSPSHLYLVGESMIPTHNTSFALGMAAHAAMERRVPVLVFSLEMSHLEITQRFLCGEARVDSSRMRNGRLLEADWTKIGHATGRLGEAPIFVDDNPNTTVMDIRAKSRRLRSRQGLGLVIVDYLQLMTGRHQAESRQVEVSEISRGLKILARELEVPVVALSQLSRNLESRADKRPVLADLRESGCLTADTRVLRADNDSEVTLGELLVEGARDVPVWSLDDGWRLVPSTLTHVFSSGLKEVFRLKLASGRTVDATANHPFRCLEGWVQLGDLGQGSRIAVTRTLPEPDLVDRMDHDEIVLLAHLLGDGCVLPRQPIHYTSADEANLNVVELAALRRFGIRARRVPQGNWWHSYLPSPTRLARGRRNPISAWWDAFGLRGCRSYDKFVPDRMFGLSRDQICLFLRHLWATDGSLCIRKTRGRPLVSLYYASTSRRLADGLQTLLLRLGIQSRIYTVSKKSYRQGFNVTVSGAEHQLSFLQEVGFHGRRGDLVPEAVRILQRLIGNPNVDTVPGEVRARVVSAMNRIEMSHRDLAVQLGEQYCGSYLLGSASRPRGFSRRRLSAIARIVEDKELTALAESDVLWDTVASIETLGFQEVYDATVIGTHNFVANGIVAHNSLEQDADVVMFIYRDELYNPDSNDRGTAEVIVAKHRNGPTGVTQLAFLEHYARFVNMARV